MLSLVGLVNVWEWKRLQEGKILLPRYRMEKGLMDWFLFFSSIRTSESPHSLALKPVNVELKKVKVLDIQVSYPLIQNLAAEMVNESRPTDRGLAEASHVIVIYEGRLKQLIVRSSTMWNQSAFTFLCERGLWFQFYENLPFFLQNTNWAYHLKCILSFWSLAPLLDFRRYKKPKHEYRDKQVQWSWGMSLIPLCLKEEEWRRGNYLERLSLSMQRRRATSEDAENGRGLPVLVRICCKCMWGREWLQFSRGKGRQVPWHGTSFLLCTSL